MWITLRLGLPGSGWYHRKEPVWLGFWDVDRTDWISKPRIVPVWQWNCPQRGRNGRHFRVRSEGKGPKELLSAGVWGWCVGCGWRRFDPFSESAVLDHTTHPPRASSSAFGNRLAEDHTQPPHTPTEAATEPGLGSAQITCAAFTNLATTGGSSPTNTQTRDDVLRRPSTRRC